MPRSGRDEAICDATLRLLAEVGYDRMSMDAVAAQARASKATIYRRWAGKRELVLDALSRRHAPFPEPADTGSLRGDLVETLTAMAAQAHGEDADLMAGVMQAMREAPDLRACMCEQVHGRRRDALRLVVARAVARGELPPGADDDARVDLAHEVAGALWAQRALIVGAPVDDAFIAHVADDVLIPLLSQSPAPRAARPGKERP